VLPSTTTERHLWYSSSQYFLSPPELYLFSACAMLNARSNATRYGEFSCKSNFIFSATDHPPIVRIARCDCWEQRAGVSYIFQGQWLPSTADQGCPGCVTIRYVNTVQNVT
jgi:hypothetical protein